MKMNTQTKPAPPKVVIAPDGEFDDITPGKKYQVERIWWSWDDEDGYGFAILDDCGFETLCFELECSTINNLNWIIAEREVSHD